MRKIIVCPEFYFGSKRITRPDSDSQCVKSIYLQVITEPYSTATKGETAVRLSDELALFSRYYQNKLNTDTMADFVRSIKDHNIPITPSQYGDAYEYCRSRYIQSPSELANYCSLLQIESDKMVNAARSVRELKSVESGSKENDENKSD